MLVIGIAEPLILDLANICPEVRVGIYSNKNLYFCHIRGFCSMPTSMLMKSLILAFGLMFLVTDSVYVSVLQLHGVRGRGGRVG